MFAVLSALTPCAFWVKELLSAMGNVIWIKVAHLASSYSLYSTLATLACSGEVSDLRKASESSLKFTEPEEVTLCED